VDYKNEIVAALKGGSFGELVSVTIRNHRGNIEAKQFKQAAIELHNSGSADLLTATLTLESGRREDYDFWIVQDFFIEVIPQLETTPRQLIDAVRVLTSLGGQDFLAGRPNSALREWATQEDRAKAMITELDENTEADAPIFCLAIEAMAISKLVEAVSLAISFLSNKGDAARCGASAALGNIDYSGAPDLAASAFKAVANLIEKTDDALLGISIYTLIQIQTSTLNKFEARLIGLLLKVEKVAGEKTVHHMALALFRNEKKLSSEIVRAMQPALVQVKSNNTGTLQQLDSALSGLIKESRIEEAREIFEPLIRRSDDPINFKAFDGFTHALLKCDTATLSQIILDWLLSGDSNLGVAVGILAAECHGRPLLIEIKLSPGSMSAEEAIVLARRAIGYLFIHPITAASILLTLLPAIDDCAQESISDLLFDPLLLNYSGELAKWLREQAEPKGETEKRHIIAALAKLDTYLQGLRKAEIVPELSPSEREQLIENQRRQQAMLEAHKKAEQQSTLASLFHRSVLLYGNRSISYVTGPENERRRHEFELNTISHSFEAPRQDILEPFQLDYMLRVFRSAKVE